MPGSGRNALDLELCAAADLMAQDAAAARELDRRASSALGMPSIVLMENAARGAAQFLRACAGADARVLVLAGKGNNGGDGLALARWWAPRAHVALLAAPDPERSPDAALQLRLLERAGVPVERGPSRERLDALAAESDVLVDALLGTGLASAPRGPVADWIAWLEASALPVLAVDLPSGLASDDGHAFSPCVRARWTVTFARPKRGLLHADGPARSGQLRVVSLGLPEPWVEARERSSDRSL